MKEHCAKKVQESEKECSRIKKLYKEMEEKLREELKAELEKLMQE